MFTLVKEEPVKRLLGRYPTLEEALLAATIHAVNHGGHKSTIFDPDGMPVECN